MKQLNLHPLPNGIAEKLSFPEALQPISGNGAFLSFRFPHLPEVTCVFTTALHGNIAFTACLDNKEKETTLLSRKAPYTLSGLCRWSELQQVHGSVLLHSPQATALEEQTALPEADGQCTDEEGTGLIIKTADCQPVLLAHKNGDFVAGLHVGWRANAAHFIQSAVADICRKHTTKPGDILAVRGPSLGPGHAQFINFEQEWPEEFLPWFDRKTSCMNLWSLTRFQLEQAGLHPEHIFGIDLCTYALAPWFFSHRRGHRGRQMALIYKNKKR